MTTFEKDLYRALTQFWIALVLVSPVLMHCSSRIDLPLTVDLSVLRFSIHSSTSLHQGECAQISVILNQDGRPFAAPAPLSIDLASSIPGRFYATPEGCERHRKDDEQDLLLLAPGNVALRAYFRPMESGNVSFYAQAVGHSQLMGAMTLPTSSEASYSERRPASVHQP